MSHFLAKSIKIYMQKIIHHDQDVFITKMKGCFNVCKLTDKINHINGLKDKHCMIISIYAEKSLPKIQHACIIKVLENIELEGIHLNIIKTIYEEHVSNTTLNIVFHSVYKSHFLFIHHLKDI